MGRRTFTGQPGHTYGKRWMHNTGIATTRALLRGGNALRVVADDIRQRDREKQRQVHDVSGTRKKCLSVGCEYKHMKGSKYCQDHVHMDYGTGWD